VDVDSPSYLSEEDIIGLHDGIVARMGGMPGIRDRGALGACVAQPKTAVFGHERFATLPEKAAAYCFFIVRDHPFFDGNKRTGFLAALHFLLINGVEPVIDEDEMFDAIHAVARGQLDVEGLAAVFRRGVEG
jgi:death-on-curing protein